MRFLGKFGSAMVLLFAAPLASARVASIEVLTRAVVWDGRYDLLSGRIHYAVDPGNRFNRPIVDLDKAAVDAAGAVEFSATFALLRPRGASNGAALVEIPNRGTARMLPLLQGGAVDDIPRRARDFGDGWLLRQGYTLAWVGWQWDAVLGPYRLKAPVAHGPKGATLRGLLRDDFMLPTDRSHVPLGHLITGRMGGTEYAVDDPDDPRDVLTVRDAPLAPRLTIPRSRWRFDADGRGVSCTFQKGRIYELIYTVRDPVVEGLGFAAVRDFVSALKHGGTELGRVDRAYGMGISQCGRFLRQMLYEGFDADEAGRLAFDGIIAHVGGAGRGAFNLRFGQPSRDAEPTSSFFYPVDVYPFSARDGLLRGTQAEGLAPKVFLSNTSFEYWGRCASLIHTTADGRTDVDQPENVRAYYFPGEEHFASALPAIHGWGDLDGQALIDPNPIKWLWRAMVSNMDAWVRGERAPPPTAVPALRGGTLLAREQVRFPRVPGLRFPAEMSSTWRYDFSTQPPGLGARYPTLVPQVDADGNDEGGVRIPEMTVPVATYTGWNLRSPAIGAPTLRVAFIGSYVPFAATAADRSAAGDPRLSLAERYGSRDDYLARYGAAVSAMVAAHWALPEDAADMIKRGAEEWDAATATAKKPWELEWDYYSRYRDENLHLGPKAPGETRIVFMGDSITEGWAKADPAFFAHGFIDRGISGQTTAQMLVRFRQDVIDLQPDAVVILGGTNDIAENGGRTTPEAIEQNLESMTELARAHGIKVILSSVLPAYAYPWKKGIAPAGEIAALNRWIAHDCAESGLIYLDYYGPMADRRGGLPDSLSKDGVHPNRAGYEIMEPLARAAVDRALAH